MNKAIPPNKLKQLGFGMIEVLVTIVIMGVGLLSVAQMQSLSTQYTHEAFQRNLANYLANDMITKLRTVPTSQLSNYAISGTNAVGAYSPRSTPNPDCSDAANSCTIAQKVNYDLWEWEQSIMGVSEQTASDQAAGGLFDANGCIAVSNNQVTITIEWTGLSQASGITTSCQDPVVENANRRQVVVTAAIYTRTR